MKTSDLKCLVNDVYVHKRQLYNKVQVMKFSILISIQYN